MVVVVVAAAGGGLSDLVRKIDSGSLSSGSEEDVDDRRDLSPGWDEGGGGSKGVGRGKVSSVETTPLSLIVNVIFVSSSDSSSSSCREILFVSRSVCSNGFAFVGGGLSNGFFGSSVKLNPRKS